MLHQYERKRRRRQQIVKKRRRRNEHTTKEMCAISSGRINKNSLKKNCQKEKRYKRKLCHMNVENQWDGNIIYRRKSSMLVLWQKEGITQWPCLKCASMESFFPLFCLAIRNKLIFVVRSRFLVTFFHSFSPYPFANINVISIFFVISMACYCLINW